MPEPTPPLHSTLPTIDWSCVDEMRSLQIEGDPDFVEELVTLFLTETPVLLDAIRQSLAESNPAGLRRAAHTLKGNCSSMGAKRLGALSLDLEKIGKEETTQGAGAICAELEREFEAVRAALIDRAK